MFYHALLLITTQCILSSGWASALEGITLGQSNLAMNIQHLKIIFASEPPSIKCSTASFDYRRVSTCINQHSMKIPFIFHCDIPIVPLFKGYPCGSYASSMPCFSRIQWCGSAPGFLQPREKGRNGGCVC